MELNRFDRVGQDCWGIKTSSEVKNQYGGRCPRCGKTLTTPDITKITIRYRQKRTTYDLLRMSVMSSPNESVALA
jgi:transcription initiation factor IIE alpha subunit